MKFILPFLAFILFLSCLTAYAKEADKECIEWFRISKIKSGTSDCAIECAALMTDMGTFTCPDQCSLLCTKELSILGRFVFYPGLTPAEKNIVAANPKNALIVYKAKNNAEASSSRNFPDQNLNDESDAFRHFIWAGLITKELGSSKAKQFLDAHENDPDQPEKERQMDQFNNNRGQLVAETLIKDQKWTLKNLEAKGLEELRSKN